LSDAAPKALHLPTAPAPSKYTAVVADSPPISEGTVVALIYFTDAGVPLTPSARSPQES